MRCCAILFCPFIKANFCKFYSRNFSAHCFSLSLIWFAWFLDCTSCIFVMFLIILQSIISVVCIISFVRGDGSIHCSRLNVMPLWNYRSAELSIVPKIRRKLYRRITSSVARISTGMLLSSCTGHKKVLSICTLAPSVNITKARRGILWHFPWNCCANVYVMTLEMILVSIAAVRNLPVTITISTCWLTLKFTPSIINQSICTSWGSPWTSE